MTRATPALVALALFVGAASDLVVRRFLLQRDADRLIAIARATVVLP